MPDLTLLSVSLTNPGTQTNFDGAVVNVSLLASDSAGNPLSYSQIGAPAGLSVATNMGNASISGTIASNADTFGPFSVTVTATDTVTGENASQPFTWNVSYQAPTVWGNMIPLSVLRNNLTDPIDLSQFASGGNGNPLQFTITSQPSNGELDPIGGSFYVYMSNPAFVGQDSFGFRATDGVGTSGTASFSIGVTNTAPTAANTGVYFTLKNQPLTISDLSTYGKSGSTVSFISSIVGQPANGQLTDLGSGKYKYTPNTGYTGPDSFTYKLNDGVTNSSTATASLNVVDQPILSNNVRLLISGLEPVVISPADLLTNAQTTSSSQTWQVTSVSTATLGQMTPNGDGTWTYTPPDGALAGFQDSFTVTITDGVNNATASYLLLVPDRPGPTPRPVSAQDQQVAEMRGVTNLFPVGLTLQVYNQNQALWNGRLAASVHQGLVGGDSIVASTTIGKILKGGGFAFLNDVITPRRDPNNNNALVGYRVAFEISPTGTVWVYVGIPTEATLRIFGASYGAGVGASLWYTVFEMAYAKQFHPRVGPIQLNAIGNFLQPLPTAADASDAVVQIANSGNAAQTILIAGMLPNDLFTQLGSGAVMTAFTPATFTQQQQPTATFDGVDAGHSYAVLSSQIANGARWTTLRNPHNRPGLAGRQFDILLTDFQQLFSTLTAPA